MMNIDTSLFEPLWDILTHMTIRGTLVLLAVGILLRFWRGVSAAQQHLVWSIACTFRTPAPYRFVVASFALSTRLQQRLSAIIHVRRSRTSVTLRTSLAGVTLMSMLTIPPAAFTPVPRTAFQSGVEETNSFETFLRQMPGSAVKAR